MDVHTSLEYSEKSMRTRPQKNLALDLAKFPDLENKCNESVCPGLPKKKKKSHEGFLTRNVGKYYY